MREARATQERAGTCKVTRPQTDYRTALYTVMSTDRDLNRRYAEESLIMAAPRRSRNFARMLGRSYAKAYVPDRPNVRDAFLIQHPDGSSHRSSEPCGICRRLAATNSAPGFALDEDDGVFIRHFHFAYLRDDRVYLAADQKIYDSNVLAPKLVRNHRGG